MQWEVQFTEPTEINLSFKAGHRTGHLGAMSQSISNFGNARLINALREDLVGDHGLEPWTR